ncbi:TPA: hypothetical protein QDB48_000912 [Burkholderia vietnamiensis]|nr:hypothetical protein [Burkholderia vietnamiensis]
MPTHTPEYVAALEAALNKWEPLSGQGDIRQTLAFKDGFDAAWNAAIAAHPGQPEPRAGVTEAEISAAARVLSDSNADLCYVDRDDNWKIHGDEFRIEAKTALEAAAAARTGASS